MSPSDCYLLLPIKSGPLGMHHDSEMPFGEIWNSVIDLVRYRFRIVTPVSLRLVSICGTVVAPTCNASDPSKPPPQRVLSLRATSPSIVLQSHEIHPTDEADRPFHHEQICI